MLDLEEVQWWHAVLGAMPGADAQAVAQQAQAQQAQAQQAQQAQHAQAQAQAQQAQQVQQAQQAQARFMIVVVDLCVVGHLLRSQYWWFDSALLGWNQQKCHLPSHWSTSTGMDVLTFFVVVFNDRCSEETNQPTKRNLTSSHKKIQVATAKEGHWSW